MLLNSTQSNIDGEEEQEEEAGQAEQGSDQVESEGECSSVVARPAKHKRKSGDSILEEYLRKKEAREEESDRERAQQRDDVTLFLLSLAPTIRRLAPEKQSWVKLKIQELCHQAEYGVVYPEYQTFHSL